MFTFLDTLYKRYKLVENEISKRFVLMLYYTLYNDAPKTDFEDVINSISSDERLLAEIMDLLHYYYSKIDFVDEPVNLGEGSVLDLHCSYSQSQILAGLGLSTKDKKHPLREGVCHIDNSNTDVLFITLNKEGSNYSPTTMYEDYPISENLFHWQTQNSAGPTTKDGRRYIEQQTDRHDVILFVRPKNKDRDGTIPYLFLGKADFVEYNGEKPMNIVWKMRNKIPAKVLEWSPLYNG